MSDIHVYLVKGQDSKGYYDCTCPVCKRHILVKLPPNFDIIEKKVGDKSITHEACSGDFHFEESHSIRDETEEHYDPFERWAGNANISERLGGKK